MQALHFALRYHERAEGAGDEVLLAAIDFAGEIDDFDRGGTRVLDLLRATDRVDPGVWRRVLEHGHARGRSADVWDALLAWAGRPVDVAGRDKSRERLTEQWRLVLEIAAAEGGWEPWAQVSSAAQTTACPVPEVWARVFTAASEHGFAYVARESAKRFVAAWGADRALTEVLWAALDEEARGRRDPDELVDLMHWLHMDQGHNIWTGEEEFGTRLLAVPGLTAPLLVDWASRRAFSVRRWAALGRALAARAAELEQLVALVASSRRPVARAIEGLVSSLPDAKAWATLLRLLAGPAATLDWAWLEVLERWKSSPEDRGPRLFSILNHLPRPPEASSPDVDHELRMLFAHLLERTPPSGWRCVIAHFRKARRGARDWIEMLDGVAADVLNPFIVETVMSVVVAPFEADPRIASPQGLLRRAILRRAGFGEGADSRRSESNR